mgnify:CR=1 FL=1
MEWYGWKWHHAKAATSHRFGLEWPSPRKRNHRVGRDRYSSEILRAGVLALKSDSHFLWVFSESRNKLFIQTTPKLKLKQWALDSLKTWFLHCSTATALVHKTIADFLSVDVAVTPTRVFPAPQGSTMIPDLRGVKSRNDCDGGSGAIS